jgi:hypothetical protein
VNAGAFLLFARLFRQQRFLPRLLDYLQKRQRVVRPERMILAARVFLGLFALAFVLLAQRSFGLINWLLDPRTGYQFHRTGAGHWYALAITFLAAAVVLTSLYTRSTHSAVLLFPVFLFCLYLLGSKALIVNFTVFFLIALWLRRYRYFKASVVVFGLGGVLLVGYTFVRGMGSLSAETVASYADYYVNAAYYYEEYERGRLPLFYGQVAFSNFWNLVPRFLYPDKPYVYGITLVNEYFYPGAAALTNTPAFSTVSWFADFGWPGVFLNAVLDFPTLLRAFLCVLVIPYFPAMRARPPIPYPRLVTYGFLMLLGPFFLAFFAFPLDWLLFLFIIIIIELLHRARFVTS